MTAWRNLLSQSVFVKLLCTYLATGIVSLAVFGAAMYVWFQKQSVEEMSEMNRLALNAIGAKTAQSLDKYKHLAYMIHAHGSVRELVEAGEPEAGQIMDVRDYVVRLLATNPDVMSVYICEGDEIVFQISGKYSPYDQSGEIVRLVREAPVVTPVPRVIRAVNGDPVRMYSLVYRPTDGAPGGSVVVNIDAGALENELFGEADTAAGAFVIADREGRVLVENGGAYWPSIAEEPFFKRMQSEDKPGGTLRLNLNGRDSAVHYAYYGNGKLYAIALADFGAMTQRLSNSQGTLLAVFGALLALLLAAAIVVSRRFYLPISDIFAQIKRSAKPGPDADRPGGEFEIVSSATQAMIERMNELERLKAFSRYAQGCAYLRNLLTTDSLIPGQELTRTLRRFGIAEAAPGRRYGVVVARIDGSRSFVAGHTQEMIELQLNKLGSIVCETVRPAADARYYPIDEQHAIVVCETDERQEARWEERIAALLRQAQDTIFRHLNISVTIGLSGLSADWTQLRDMYRTAYSVTDYRFYYGKRSLLTGGLLAARRAGVSLEPLMRQIAKHVRKGDRPAYEAALDEAIAAGSRAVHAEAVDAFAELAYELLRMPAPAEAERTGAPAGGSGADAFPPGPVRAREPAPDFASVQHRVAELEDAAELRQWLLELYDGARERLDGAHTKATQPLMEEIVRVMRERYRDPELSANAAAESLGITPQYFGKVLKEHTGCTFPDYLNSLRLERARELIAACPAAEIKHICEQVGYHNRAYFTTLFKHRFGVTPSQMKNGARTVPLGQAVK